VVSTVVTVHVDVATKTFLAPFGVNYTYPFSKLFYFHSKLTNKPLKISFNYHFIC